ncbi:hypothetical protein BDZ91DRAFT_442356 [Kalaharituber pfeilii]|nr:hypothetical protein BDZ91DRAFT_442356 [Kalaharituber pfeilii]
MSSCRMGSLPEMPSGPADHTGLDSAFWRLTSSPMTPSQYPVYSQQVSLGSIPSLHPATSPDAPDDSIWPHRLNSIDQELAPGVIYPQFSADVDYNRSVSELYSTSASASTASLVASVTDVSNQSYLAPWVNASSAGVNIHSNAVMKIETFDGYYPPDAKYQELTDETSSMFPSPLQSPKFVS